MIEVVFGSSAGGSLKVAQTYGKGKYHGGAVSIFIRHADGQEVKEEELEAAKQEYLRKEQENWEKAVPLGGNAGDVFVFELALSVGDISGIEIGESRKQALKNLYGTFPEDEKYVRACVENARKNLPGIFARMAKGEEVRIWYSDHPDETCGLYWFLFQLHVNKVDCDSVTLIKLPNWEYGENNTIIRRQSWGDVSAEEWHRYLPLQKKGSALFIRMCAEQWRELQEENMSLRAVVNGRVSSVPEDIYDPYIMREIPAEGEEFNMARVVGRILGKYRLGISDGWIRSRLEKIVSMEAGKCLEK